jgi:hypothetical protein
MLLEPGPVVLVSTASRGKNNIMTISWHMVIDFTPQFALMTGTWNYSFEALMKNRECVVAIPNIFILDAVHAWIDSDRKERRTIHANGDGTFIVDGRTVSYRKLMLSKLPPGV